jgi:hypothetical protein
METLEYTIDAEDVFVDIEGDWRGRSMWSAVDGAEAHTLWKALLERARQGNGEIRLRYRCDTPTERRRFEVVLRGAPDGSVTFAHRPLERTARTAVRALEDDVPRDDELLKMCSWCGRVVGPDGSWLEIEELDVMDTPRLPRVTHGICPDCFEAVRAAAAARGH